MAVSNVDKVKVSTAGALSLDGTLATPPGAGDAVTVNSMIFDSTGYPTATDTKGNAYTARASVTNSSVRARALTAHNVTGGATFTVTLASPENDTKSMVVAAWTGVSAAPFDVGTTNTGTGTTSSVATGALAQANEVVVAHSGFAGADTTQVALNVPPWVQTGEETTNMDNNTIHKIVADATGETASWTVGASRTWLTTVVTLKAAGPSYIFGASH